MDATMETMKQVNFNNSKKNKSSGKRSKEKTQTRRKTERRRSQAKKIKQTHRLSLYNTNSLKYLKTILRQDC